MIPRSLLVFFLALILSRWGTAAELAVLTNQNWDRLAPQGKEVDCILGDYVLKSDKLWVVVGQPLADRNANMTVKQVGGAIIDLTLVEQPNDQLSAFYPGRREFAFSKASMVAKAGKKVILSLEAKEQKEDKEKKKPALPKVQLEYELEDGQAFVLLRSVFVNTFENDLTFPLEDDLRMDNVTDRSKTGPTDLFWVHDKHFEQAYGVIADKHQLQTQSTISQSILRYEVPTTKKAVVTLKPGESYTLERRIFPGAHLLQVKGAAAKFRGEPVLDHVWKVVDPKKEPIVGAELILKDGENLYGTARTDKQGTIRAFLPVIKYDTVCKAIGRPPVEDQVKVPQGAKESPNYVFQPVYMEAASQVTAKITNEKGGPIPCKVAFKGLDETPSPNWGPAGARQAVLNLFYSVNGSFTVPINPGDYEAIISYGTEFDVVRQKVTVKKGETTSLQATLKRAYDTPGWVSADFHSHASPSGDNTSDQMGRVINLICEQIDFAPCTEHNRIDSYVPHLKALKAEHLLGTCTGIELTGTPLPLNHQNAFPLKLIPRTQDNGAPLIDLDPALQIKRLAEWQDPKAERLVQQNHPDIGWLFFDKDGDGKPDEGFKSGFPYMHVIEVHPIDDILDLNPELNYLDKDKKKVTRNNTIFNWLQLLNKGYRIPGVVNTDAHYNFHGSGGLRNYVKCDTKVPGDIDPLDIVRESKKGHIIITNGPYLEVKLNDALPGDDLKLPGGKGKLKVKVCCPDWFDIDRVQVLVNGRPDKTLNFTRKTHAKLFKESATCFEQELEVSLEKDAHLIVVATSENTDLGEVMGPMWGKQQPTAVSNPIFVDVDGNGFQPNGDTLGHPLPLKSGTKKMAN